MDADFIYCSQIEFAIEQGYSNDPHDPGNWTGGAVGHGELRGTKYGIAAADHPQLDIKNLTEQQAADILRSGYWNVAGCSGAGRGLDLCAFDAAINCGPGHARAWLRRSRNIDTFQDISLAYHRGIRTWKLYGTGWTRRINTIRKYALAMNSQENWDPPQKFDGMHLPKVKHQPLTMWARFLDLVDQFPSVLESEKRP